MAWTNFCRYEFFPFFFFFFFLLYNGNKIMSSIPIEIFLQVMYIPDKDYVPPPSVRSSTSSEPMDTVNRSPRITPVGSPETRPTMVIYRDSNYLVQATYLP